MFFFFQAEDGIRDGTVTGVQTCALPISLAFGGEDFPLCAHGRLAERGGFGVRGRRRPRPGAEPQRGHSYQSRTRAQAPRSEERRVGKECRSRWWLGV